MKIIIILTDMNLITVNKFLPKDFFVQNLINQLMNLRMKM